ncbi:MAG: CdaR family protein [Lachnospiraceae bacterium]|nr:CdaR family protein [Lachnospiraceae bacterium]
MRTRLSNNFSLKILAFLVAGLLWLIVVNIDDPITDQNFNNIPVTLINTEVLASEESPKTYQILDNTQNVTVTVKAKRSVLSRLSADDITAVANMKELTLGTQIPIEVTVKNVKVTDAYATPRNLQVKLEDEETKKFPIVPKTTGTVRDGFVLGQIEAVPEKVSIRGPKSVIDKISKVEATVSVSGLSKSSTLESELKLYDEEGSEIDQKLLSNNLGTEGVDIHVELLNTKNVPLHFDTSRIHTAAGYEFANIKYEPKEISVSGDVEKLQEISEIYIPASALAASGLKEKTEKVIDVSGFLPQGIVLADENAGSVAVTIMIEKDGTKSYEASVGSITVLNLDKDLSINYESADALDIQIRGPEDMLSKFEPDKNISIDLKEYTEPGKYTIPIKVDLPERCVLEKELSVSIVLEDKTKANAKNEEKIKDNN